MPVSAMPENDLKVSTSTSSMMESLGVDRRIATFWFQTDESNRVAWERVVSNIKEWVMENCGDLGFQYLPNFTLSHDRLEIVDWDYSDKSKRPTPLLMKELMLTLWQEFHTEQVVFHYPKEGEVLTNPLQYGGEDLRLPFTVHDKCYFGDLKISFEDVLERGLPCLIPVEMMEYYVANSEKFIAFEKSQWQKDFAREVRQRQFVTDHRECSVISREEIEGNSEALFQEMNFSQEESCSRKEELLTLYDTKLFNDETKQMQASALYVRLKEYLQECQQLQKLKAQLQQLNQDSSDIEIQKVIPQDIHPARLYDMLSELVPAPKAPEVTGAQKHFSFKKTFSTVAFAGLSILVAVGLFSTGALTALPFMQAPLIMFGAGVIPPVAIVVGIGLTTLYKLGRYFVDRIKTKIKEKRNDRSVVPFQTDTISVERTSNVRELTGSEFSDSDDEEPDPNPVLQAQRSP